MIKFFLFFFQRNMKKKIIIRTSLFLYTCVVIGVVTVLVQKIRTNQSKQKSPTEEETTTEETTTEETTTEETTTEDSINSSTVFQKSANTVKVLSIIVFVLEVLMLFFLLYLCNLFYHNHKSLLERKFFQNRSKENNTNTNSTEVFITNNELIPKIKINMVVSTLFVFANILIIVIPVLLYHNMDKLKFILNGIGIFLYLVTMVSLLTGENRTTSGEIVQTGIGLLMQKYDNPTI